MEPTHPAARVVIDANVIVKAPFAQRRIGAQRQRKAARVEGFRQPLEQVFQAACERAVFWRRGRENAQVFGKADHRASGEMAFLADAVDALVRGQMADGQVAHHADCGARADFLRRPLADKIGERIVNVRFIDCHIIRYEIPQLLHYVGHIAQKDEHTVLFDEPAALFKPRRVRKMVQRYEHLDATALERFDFLAVMIDCLLAKAPRRRFNAAPFQADAVKLQMQALRQVCVFLKTLPVAVAVRG